MGINFNRGPIRASKCTIRYTAPYGLTHSIVYTRRKYLNFCKKVTIYKKYTSPQILITNENTIPR